MDFYSLLGYPSLKNQIHQLEKLGIKFQVDSISKLVAEYHPGEYKDKPYSKILEVGGKLDISNDFVLVDEDNFSRFKRLNGFPNEKENLAKFLFDIEKLFVSNDIQIKFKYVDRLLEIYHGDEKFFVENPTLNFEISPTEDKTPELLQKLAKLLENHSNQVLFILFDRQEEFATSGLTKYFLFIGDHSKIRQVEKLTGFQSFVIKSNKVDYRNKNLSHFGINYKFDDDILDISWSSFNVFGTFFFLVLLFPFLIIIYNFIVIHTIQSIFSSVVLSIFIFYVFKNFFESIIFGYGKISISNEKIYLEKGLVPSLTFKKEYNLKEILRFEINSKRYWGRYRSYEVYFVEMFDKLGEVVKITPEMPDRQIILIYQIIDKFLKT